MKKAKKRRKSRQTSLYMVYAKDNKTKKYEAFYQVFVSLRLAKKEIKEYYKRRYAKTHYAWKIKKLTSQDLKKLRRKK